MDFNKTLPDAKVLRYFETHAHTNETSCCSDIPAQRLVLEYINAGYSGMCITDHISPFYYEYCNTADWNNFIDIYLKGYHAAKKAAEGTDFVVLLGAEVTLYGYPNDYLLFGIDEDFLYSQKQILRSTPKELYEKVHKSGAMLFQAHPFRPMQFVVDPKYLDGIEVYNGHTRHKSNNPKALEYALKNNLLFTAGSDAHQFGETALSGLKTKSKIKDKNDLLKILKNQDFEIIKNTPLPG